MQSWSVVNGKKLRNGVTTGSCAAGAAMAAAQGLLSGKSPDTVELDTPKGLRLRLDITDFVIEDTAVSCAVVKDAGDDPDVTDGIKIWAKVEKIPSGLFIDGGSGVGRVTKIGLPRPIGEAAINPVPMEMIKKAVSETALSLGYLGGLRITISAENGEEVSKRTFNPRLGIMGGISILGTGGVVEPMSSVALMETIRLEIRQQAAIGKECLLICLGNYSISSAFDKFALDGEKGVKCSNFIGEALDYAVYCGFKKILVLGHAGKLVKLAGGIMDTHSRTADCRQEIFAAHAALAGVCGELITKIMDAATTDEIDILLTEAGLKERVWETIMEKIIFHVNYRLKGSADCRFVVFTDKSGGVKLSCGAEDYIKIINNGSGN